MLLGLLVFGLLGPITTYTWKLAVRAAETAEETQESLDKAFALSRIMARLSGARRLPPCPPRERPEALHVRRARVLPPAQVITPRAVVVWRPSSPVPDEEPFAR
ncbi:hypothetical protein BON30_05330 [Cystobacter ferrugineus]|uniref:Uncharacterized protein n=2 Tax=Cystobacter ferrugineus TaxID=83449 RepID=A0A1L9BK54_9BACT|nr:hypothetical protein BON30_05330 [Cystobacter ferrugineus]